MLFLPSAFNRAENTKILGHCKNCVLSLRIFFYPIKEYDISKTQSVNQVSKEMKNIDGEELPRQTTRNCPFGLFGGLCNRK
jgi:hypothetical protein